MTTGAPGDEISFDLDLLGTTLEERYRVDSVLGVGGMGNVYLATDLRLERRVVVKVPHTKFLAERGFRERFEKEIRSLTSLEHPHVVKALDAGTVRGVPYAVLQHLSGGSLRDRLAGRAAAPGDLLAWLPAVAGALDFIHRQGVVHRDVKPANILFDSEGHPVLADFGIAKALGTSDTGLTGTGATPGSPDYMSPEAVTRGTVSPSYDQYALGVVVYQALAGRLPYEGETPLQVLVAKASAPPRPLAAVAPHVPPPLSDAVMRCLERDPAARFPSCGAFADACREALVAAGLVRDATPVAATGGATPDPAPATAPAASSGLTSAAFSAIGRHDYVIPLSPPPEASPTPTPAPGTAYPLPPMPIAAATEALPPPPVPVGSPVPAVALPATPTGAGTRAPARSGARRGRWVAATAGIAVLGGLAWAVGRFGAGGDGRPRATESAAAAFLAGWAVEAPNAGVDPATGFPSRVRRLRDDSHMVLIPAGTFEMGAPEGDTTAADDERPRHRVTLTKAYYLDVSEVTVGQYRRFSRATGKPMPDLGENAGDRLPVHHVSHVEATAYAEWAGVALPTEAQWERAAKGGHDDWPYPWGLTDDAKKRNSAGSDDGYPDLAPIGSFDPNPFGLHDMGGNVWEWCADGYDERAYDRGDAVDPVGPASAPKRVARGGGCLGEVADVACRLRVTFRLALSPQVRNAPLGFRCARGLP